MSDNAVRYQVVLQQPTGATVVSGIFPSIDDAYGWLANSGVPDAQGNLVGVVHSSGFGPAGRWEIRRITGE